MERGITTIVLGIGVRDCIEHSFGGLQMSMSSAQMKGGFTFFVFGINTDFGRNHIFDKLYMSFRGAGVKRCPSIVARSVKVFSRFERGCRRDGAIECVYSHRSVTGGNHVRSMDEADDIDISGLIGGGCLVCDFLGVSVCQAIYATPHVNIVRDLATPFLKFGACQWTGFVPFCKPPLHRAALVCLTIPDAQNRVLKNFARDGADEVFVLGARVYRLGTPNVQRRGDSPCRWFRIPKIHDVTARAGV